MRGQLFHLVGDVTFAEFKHAAGAWSAVDALAERRRECLATMKANAGPSGDDRAFSDASKTEAELAAQIRRLRRASGAS